MRYRRLSYRYAMMVRSGQRWPFGDIWQSDRVVEGRRLLPSCQEGAVYHAAGIRQGPFQLELPLPAPVDAERVEARYDRGLLRITLPKRAEAG